MYGEEYRDKGEVKDNCGKEALFVILAFTVKLVCAVGEPFQESQQEKYMEIDACKEAKNYCQK